MLKSDLEFFKTRNNEKTWAREKRPLNGRSKNIKKVSNRLFIIKTILNIRSNWILSN